RRMGWLASLVFAIAIIQSIAAASPLADAARQLAHKVAAATGPGAIALEISNRSSLDEKSVREIRSALEAELRIAGVRLAKPEESVGAVTVTLSESVREYVWSAEITVGSDERKVALISLPRPQTGTTPGTTMAIALRKTFLFTQAQPILDAALVEIPGGSRLLVLDDEKV